MFSAQSTNFPGGVTNAAPWQTFGEAGMPDPSWSQMYHNDFNGYAAADWTVTNTGAATNANTAEVGGVLLNTTTTGATDATFLQLVTASYKLTAGKQHFLKARIKPSDATTSDVYVGLIMTSTTPLTANDGLFFFKATGATTWVLRSIVGGAATDLALGAANVAANATYIELGFYVDGSGNVAAFFNPTTGNNSPAAGAVRGWVATFAPTLTAVLLAPSFGIRNGAGAAKTLSVDYLTVASER